MRRDIGFALGLFVVATTSSCHGSPLAKIEALRDALAVGNMEGALAVVEVAPCAEPRTQATMAACLDATARAFGATGGFSADHPDQASAAAVAYILTRNHEGVGIPKPDTWLEAVATASGPGADALRIAVVTAMADAAPSVGKHVDDDPAARALAGAVARAIPGACSTYARLGAGAEAASFSPPESPDHSPCVQHDLERRDGPGPAYGDGLWRAAAGAATLWKEANRAVIIGFGTTEGLTRRAIQKKLAVIDPATRQLTVRIVGTTQAGAYGATDAHSAEGVPLGLNPGAKEAGVGRALP
jgi:hypothetical protein